MLSFEIFFFFKQNTAYEMRISDWSSDVCSSDLLQHLLIGDFIDLPRLRNDAWIGGVDAVDIGEDVAAVGVQCGGERNRRRIGTAAAERRDPVSRRQSLKAGDHRDLPLIETSDQVLRLDTLDARLSVHLRSEAHTYDLPSLM